MEDRLNAPTLGIIDRLEANALRQWEQREAALSGRQSQFPAALLEGLLLWNEYKAGLRSLAEDAIAPR